MKFGELRKANWEPSFLNSEEIPTTAKVPEWEDCKARFLGLDDDIRQTSRYKKLVDKANLVIDLEGLIEFNKVINGAAEYQTDKFDYWFTPNEFLGHGHGDCEDYAICKFMALRFLKPRIVIVKTVDGGNHALCAVKMNDKWHFLDNKTDKIYPEEDLAKVYEPIVSMDHKRVWKHRRAC